MERQAEILEFIKSKSLMTISSISSDGNCQAALVGFGETLDFQIIFGTSNTSRKYQNILKNPKVAVVIGLEYPKTLQLEGTARELKGFEQADCVERYIAKDPEVRAKFRDLDDQRWLLIDPTWARYTDISPKPWDIVELKF